MKVTNTYGQILDLAVLAPTVQVFDFGWNDGDSKLSWTRGNGSRVLIFIKEASAVGTLPFDGVTYVLDGYYSGDTVIYKGTGVEVVLAGLTNGVEYHVRGFEYNGQAGIERYLRETALGNPYSFIPGTTIDGARLLEDGDFRLLEDGDYRLLE